MLNRSRTCRWTRTPALFAVLGVVPVASADTIFVNAADNTPPFNGTSPATAYRFLQDAIRKSGQTIGPDEILVAGSGGTPLVYKPDQGDIWQPPANHREASFALESGNQLLGGWAGPSNPTVRDPAVYQSVLSGAIGQATNTDNSYHVVTATNVDAATRLDGFTIQDGYSANLDGDYAAASCFGEHVPPRAGGAGMECYNADLQIRNCTFRNNQSLQGGGLRLLCNSDGLIVNCTFQDNDAMNGTPSGGNGGGLYLYGTCSPKVINCTFTSNHANHIGGGTAFQAMCSPEFTQCVFNGNSAGDGVDLDYGGGMRLGFDCTASIRLCVFYGNTCIGSTCYGGGFSANRDEQTEAGSVTINSCIFFENTAAAGSQLYRDSDTNVTISIAHCDVQGGQAGLGGAGTFTWGTGNYNQDPLFISPSTGNFSIPYTSPCINNGDPSDLPADAADLDGDSNFTEVIPKDGLSQTRQVNPSNCVDGGIAENQQAGGCTGDITGTGGVPDGTVNIDDLLLVTTRWGQPGGSADIAPDPCGDTNVTIDDYLVVINHWGNCPTGNRPSGPEGEGDDGGGLPVDQQIEILLAMLADHPELATPILEIIEALTK